MKVLLVNGSPREKGCTYTALSIVGEELNAGGMETEIFHVGTEPIEGCRACGYCMHHTGCVIGDVVNAFMSKVIDTDGFVFGSPVYYAAASGQITSFMDRVFFSSGRHLLRGKPAAAIVSCRRAGSTAALDQLNKYFLIKQMPIVSSQYWNMVHGQNPDEVRLDLEGVQIMRTLGKNMVWLLRCIEAGRQAGVALPPAEPVIFTNFIR